MEQKKLNYFKKRLENLQEAYQKETGILDDFQHESLREDIGELTTYDNHPGDTASEVERREVEGTLLRIEEDLLAHVDEALEAIRNGTYGICQVCHKEIPLERLEAMPEATTCVEHHL